jgi:ParB-like chromosome segregation protein Spo0J
VSDKSTLEQVNDLYQIADYMEDEELSKALEFIAKLILKPDIPLSVASVEIVRMQAIAAKLSLRARWLTNVEKGNVAKKNMYYTAAAELDKIVASLKYLVKA